MRNAAILLILITFNLSFAQNKNVKDETKTTTTTIKTSEGEKKIIKDENTREVQVIEVGNKKDNTVNRDIKNSPVIVSESTQVSTNNSDNKNKNIDRSSFYLLNGKKYKVLADPKGYTVVSEKNKNYARIRQTSNNTYIFTRKNKTSYGHFDANGDLILETYDPKKDIFVTERVTILK
ncbi:hypothetical protein [Flavobacterium orientale]|uniref:Uncharacterized protein n=1 Tax=Flavobacterium orientale TaxID=1756020 RepID=A0A916Y147_9FLAO|nr:hypothetical protein [Flavobacterium orientale]GGD25088.1 hypothetical protein GCM10011343_14090 [Flavobacterium orientale]